MVPKDLEQTLLERRAMITTLNDDEELVDFTHEHQSNPSNGARSALPQILQEAPATDSLEVYKLREQAWANYVQDLQNQVSASKLCW